MRKALAPTEVCAAEAESFIRGTTAESRKRRGQFFTPREVARFMAGLVPPPRIDHPRILDPGAGTGILACALCEMLAREKGCKYITLDAYEDDFRLAKHLRLSLEHAKQWASTFGTVIDYNIITRDFIIDNYSSLFNHVRYDIIIGNPPYFKIGKDDPHAIAASEFVHGQPNIYALFMGLAAKMLKEEGLFVFITPRSYAAGPYFKVFRSRFFDIVTPQRIHLFDSRRDAFRKDAVLQENVILQAQRAAPARTVTISTSQGISDLETTDTFAASISEVLLRLNGDVILRLPTDREDRAVIRAVERWDGTLRGFGMEISTGPVVPFRAENLITSLQGNAPLLWMHNISAMSVRWPYNGNKNGQEKKQYIIANEEAMRRKLLVRNTNLVLLRRFSAKEQDRRLTAAPLFTSRLPSPVLGIENHLNYIYRPGGTLSEDEASGLAALLNSSLLDKYFRISNGNTQVSATELRAMPLPSLHAVRQLGATISSSGADSLPLGVIDSLVAQLAI